MSAKFTTKDLSQVEHMSRKFVCYQVMQNELDQLNAGYSSAHLTLFGVALGAFSTVVINWIAGVNAPLSITAYCTYLCTTIITGFFALYMGWLAVRDYRNSNKLIQRIKDDSTPFSVVQARREVPPVSTHDL
jgi:hypothetical protein